MERLSPRALDPLPTGSIRPRGWLRDQCRLQADGLTGHLDEFWPSVRDSRWIGGDAEGWERGPYWLDGLIPLAAVLDDEWLRAKARRWIDYILEHQHEDGWLGAKDDRHEGEGENALDPWPLFVLFKAMAQWQEATGDARIVPAMLRCAKRIERLLTDEGQPLRSWARLRWADLVLSLHWLYERTGEGWLLDLARTVHDQGYDWRDHFENFRHTEKTRREQLGQEVALPLHGVNNGMGMKTGPVWWRQSGDEGDRANLTRALAVLDRYHGAATGMCNADEHLAGLNPSQGHETCHVVEAMYSLETGFTITGDTALADRLERIAFNALPGHTTPDMWAHQYHGAVNQVLCTHEPRPWTDSGPRANLYGQDVNFGCCQANLHQGWPKFVAHLWMRKGENELTAVSYAPCEVAATLDGAPVRIEVVTEYPFRETVTLRVHIDGLRQVRFALSGFVPGWTEEATVILDGAEDSDASAAEPGGFWRFERLWSDGDSLRLHLPMPLRSERRFNNAMSIYRGPILLALRIGERFRALDGPHASPYTAAEPNARECEVFPTTPWNYALEADEEVLSVLRVHERPLSSVPFDPAQPPLVVDALAYRVADWRLVDGVAAPPPVSPLKFRGPRETVELVPFGSTHLRIAEIPTVEEEWKSFLA